MQGATIAIYNCIEVIIPSMYGLMILSEIFIRTNLYKIFPGNSGLFFVSLIAGYPVAIKLLADLNSKNLIDKNKFDKMSLYCYAGSPTYIAGCVSWQLYENRSLTLLIFLSIMMSNLTIFAITLFSREPKVYKPKVYNSKVHNSQVYNSQVYNSKVRESQVYKPKVCNPKDHNSQVRKPKRKKNNRKNIRFSTDIITESVLSAAKALLKICAMLVACSILWQVIGSSNYIIAGIYDISNIIYFPKLNYNLLPLITALVSFGGVCVILQLIALTSGKLNLFIFVPVRILAAGVAFLYCKLLSPFLLDESYIGAAKSVELFEGNSVFVSVILLGMTFLCLELSVSRSRTQN
jgi:hypothetical protein